MNAIDLYTKSSSATPPDQMDAAMARIQVVWNEAIPRRKFRKWTPTRITGARATLRIWTVSEVIGGIRCYARAPWQNKNRKWQRIDTWLAPSMATTWCEQAEQDAEDAEWKRKAADARVAKRTDTLADALRIRDQDEALLAGFHGLSKHEQAAIFAKANDEIVAVAGRRMRPKQLTLDTHLIRQHVLMILRRGAAT